MRRAHEMDQVRTRNGAKGKGGDAALVIQRRAHTRSPGVAPARAVVVPSPETSQAAQGRRGYGGKDEG